MLMNNEAGTPLSDTSPMMKHRCLSSSMKKSYKSPPTSRAGTRLAASENRPAATLGCAFVDTPLLMPVFERFMT